MKINILNKSVFNQISAGEIVDGPYSVVKELVENSIDAGATEIDIFIENGGKSLIKIADNGCGMAPDDLPASLLPHATSKISSARDLNNVKTLGFRGEALASISSVSRVEIVSIAEGEHAHKIICEGGEVFGPVPAALDKGTVITVKDLFFNTPVRGDYLNSEKKEESKIVDYVARFILGRPDLSFRLYVDNKLKYKSYGSGLYDAVAEVYGGEITTKCFRLLAVKNGYEISGFISNQNYFKANKTYQTVFVNGRYVQNSNISTAIQVAYSAYAMKRQFPLVVLNIKVPQEEIDVNYHPNKLDVRFKDGHKLFSALHSVLKSVLDGDAEACKYVVSPDINDCNLAFSVEENKAESLPEKKEVVAELKPSENISLDEIPVFEEEKITVTAGEVENSAWVWKLGDDSLTTKKTLVDDITWGQSEASKKAREMYRFEQEMINYESRKYQGQIFETYLLYEIEDTLYVIDQHAAHEKLLYEENLKKLQTRVTQVHSLIEPYILKTNPIETQFIEDHISTLMICGIDIHCFGEDLFRINAVPYFMDYKELDYFFKELLSEAASGKKMKFAEIIKDKIATASCRAAIKAGDRLTEKEADVLFNFIEKDINVKCPHGRPICCKIKKTEIEKMFKRKL